MKEIIKFQYIPILLLLLFTVNCSNKRDELFISINANFHQEIKNSNAHHFGYQYDGLQPQNSYFVKCKLKFLELERHGELNNIKELVFFENDSVSKICRLQEIYDEKSEGGRNLNKKNDSVSIINFQTKDSKTYFNGKLIRNSKITKSLQAGLNYIYTIKNSTESEYNCGK